MLRRNFLKLTGLGTAAIALPSVGFASVSLKDAAVGAIINEFDYLILDRKGVEAFVDDFLPYYYWNGHLKYSMVMRSLYFFKIKSDRAYSTFRIDMLRSLAEKYLLSTDFFINGMDESKPLKYLGLYSPHLTPCANPFSHIHYPSVEIS